MRKLIPILFLVAAACGASDSTSNSGGYTPVNQTPTNTNTTPVASTSVILSGSSFAPPNIQVSPGAVVTFTNNDNIEHNVTFTSANVTSISGFTNGTKTVTMPVAAGTYAYQCTIHAGMQGTVVVQ